LRIIVRGGRVGWVETAVRLHPPHKNFYTSHLTNTRFCGIRVIVADPSTLPDANFETFLAEKVHLYVNGVLTDFPGLSRNAKFSVFHDHALPQMVAQIHTWCVSGRIQERIETRKVEWPDGPWQAFKHKYAPKWLLRWFPVRVETRSFTVDYHTYFVCPHLI